MGYVGNILRVDLTRGTTEFEALDRFRAKNFIGGRGLGISYLLEEVDPRCDPLSAENKLVMMTGPLTGTMAPTGARYAVVTKSPLTGALTCSNSGGQFPAILKRTGVDGMVIQGASSEPVYLYVEENRAELRSASHLWGKDTHRTDEILKRETDERARVACIGPAGERGVLFAAVMNDKDRAAGRSGVGAVMGSKGLKAVVAKGNLKVPLHNEGTFRAVCKEYLDRFKKASKDAPPPLRTYGTAIAIGATQKTGIFPSYNFRQGVFEEWEKIGGERLTERYLLKPRACFSCPIACGRVTEVPDGPYQGKGEGPEYESVFSLGSACGVSDLAAVTKANYICNELGLDTISMGVTIATAMELYEKGLLDERTLGRPLPFGDAEGLIEMCRKTGLKEGFGEHLASGSLRLAARFGRPDLAMVSKGQELAAYDPRGAKGVGLAYATSPIGASHMRAHIAYIEIFGVPMRIDAWTWEDKPQLVKDWQEVFAVMDSAGICAFFAIRNLVTPTRDIRPEGILRLLNAATDADYDMESLVKAGERIFNAERLFLVRAGLNKKDDTLPSRLTSEPMPAGPAKGQICELDRMLPMYYQLRGWDDEGRPTRKKLEELGL